MEQLSDAELQEWKAAAEWVRNNYQDYPTIDSLTMAMIAAAPTRQVLAAEKKVQMVVGAQDESLTYLADDIVRAMTRSWQFGHEYWRAADKKSPQAERVRAEFDELKSKVRGDILIALSPAPSEQDKVAWIPLSDVQWMNIVNHDHSYWNYDKDDAVHEAVKRTEAKLKEINLTNRRGGKPEPEKK